jgi:hypothetical protein
VNLGGSVYAIEDEQGRLGQVGPSPHSTASRPLWGAWRLNPDGYLGPLGGPWDHPTRKAAIAHLRKAVGR